MDLKHWILNRKGNLDKPPVDYISNEANELVFNSIISDSPIMIARFGAFELGITNSAITPFNLRNLWRLCKGDITSIGWNNKLASLFCNNAGFFPNERRYIEQFAKLLIEDMSELDILASWLPAERRFSEILAKVRKIRRIDLEPFLYDKPWTRALRGKTVLVIHPYEDTIKYQWINRDKLFPNPEVLPSFNLKIIKAIQSAGGNKTEFQTWFEALDHMKSQIEQSEFDIALIGCGAYGFHLAAHVKRLGKKAVHMGGILQVLFGILGGRWDGMFPFVNEYWRRPLLSDIANNMDGIENGCYI